MNILLIDDHTLFRSGVEIMLNKLEPKTIIQSYDNYSNAAHTVTNPTDINLILLDYHIPGSSAVSNIENTRKTFENAKLVILSSENEPIKIVSTIDSGAAGFISKSSKPEILIAALKLVLANI